MCLCLLRRSLIKTAMLAPVLLGCEPAAVPAPGPSPTLAGRWLDVHCHVFNGSDLPIYEFVKRTRLDSLPGGWIAAPLLAFLAGGSHHDAPSPAIELAELQGTGGPRVALASAAPADPLTGLLRLRDRVVAGPRTAAIIPESGSGLVPPDAEGLRLFDAAFRETGIRTSSSLAGPARSAAIRPAAPSTQELQKFDAQVRANGVLSRYFQWGLLFSEPRNALVGRLTALYPPGAELMVTPAMVDYDAWLDAADTQPGEQVRVMREIAISRARAAQPVHAFASFDPWRALARRDAIGRGAAGPDLVEALKADLASGAVIGVKLYPPMGFGAGGNATRGADLPFPEKLVRLTRGRPGPALDDVLGEVFDHCADNGIPVMAHCGPSNASSDIYKTLASPDYWGIALRQPGRPRRRELRLNLGHFGGIWDLGDGTGNQQTWARTICAMMREFPNVYADIAYFGSVLHPDQADIVRQTAAFIGDQADQPGATVKQRIMYGSDWSMIGQEPSSDGYAEAAIRALAPVWRSDVERQDLQWRNAARFLGLGRSDPTRQRLQGFYAANAINTDALDRFDPAQI